MEVANLKLYDLDNDRGTVFIYESKGKKDRTVPIGERACAWIKKYIDEIRSSLVMEPDEGYLFISDLGKPYRKNQMGDMVKKYILKAGINKPGSCHLFRHAMATHMLENGADIRYIQAILGHSDLSSTQIYTQVSIKKLKEIHTATHPAKLERVTSGEQNNADTEEALLTLLAEEAETADIE
ncbi:MAG: tyrosine-type recombinase/integrase [Proteobacteria bacterium]|nr:tyrosine-type recombinase/integrase [Pseudomonadota bacterium]